MDRMRARRSNHRGRPESHGLPRRTVRIPDGDQHQRMGQIYYERHEVKVQMIRIHKVDRGRTPAH